MAKVTINPETGPYSFSIGESLFRQGREYDVEDEAILAVLRKRKGINVWVDDPKPKAKPKPKKKDTNEGFVANTDEVPPPTA